METMKAIVYTGYKKLQYMEVPVPECGDEEIVIEVRAAAICGADMHWYTGIFNSEAEAPFILGHEFSGVIAKVGSRVRGGWQVGDRVAADNTGIVCGHCDACAQGDFAHCPERVMMGGGVDGAFAKYVKIPGEILCIYPNCLFKLPENISFEEAAVLEPASGGYSSVIQEARVMAGETVVVHGIGALGLFPIQMAKIAGASMIIAVGKKVDRDLRMPLAKKLGADYVLAADDDYDLADKILELAGDTLPSVLIDAVGAPDVMNEAFRYLQNMARIVRIGNMEAEFNHSLVPIHAKMLTVIGHVGYNTISWRRTIRLAENGQMDLKSVVTARLPMAEYQKAFQMYSNHEAARVVLIPE